jgi:hypothetical protein
MKNIKKLLLGLSVTTIMGTNVSAQEGPALELENLADVSTKLQQRLHQSSESLRSLVPELDQTASAYVAMKQSEYVPVVIAGKRFMTDLEGSILIDPKSSYSVTEADGLQRVSDTLMDLDFSAVDSNFWLSHELPEGVEKTGDLYVVTDPTCGYCKQVEKEVDSYLASGIQVHYIPYPRTGVVDRNKAGFKMWSQAACSDFPAKAYKKIALGDGSEYPAPENLNDECTEVITKGFAYGQKIGVTGTPFMYAVSVDGIKVTNPGYVPASDLAPRIGVKFDDGGAQQFLGQ